MAYQSAWVLQSSLLFYAQTGDKNYFQEAQRLAGAAIASWILPSGALRETGQWGGSDLCDALLALYQVDRNLQWYATAVRMLHFRHDQGRDSKGRYGNYWQEAISGRSLPRFYLLHMATVARPYWAAAAVRPPVIRVVVPTSQSTGQPWRYVTEAPPENWQAREFDDATWKTGLGGYGVPETPGSVVRTPWSTKDLWLRRTFTIAEKTSPQNVHLLVHHDDDAEIYLNGQPISRLTGYTTMYTYYPVRSAATVPVPGTNVLAIHVRQDFGGQYIDAGLVSVSQSSATTGLP